MLFLSILVIMMPSAESMTLVELLPILRNLNIRIWIEDANLRYQAPRGALTPTLKAALAARKEELRDVLAAQSRPPVPATTGQSAPQPLFRPPPPLGASDARLSSSAAEAAEQWGDSAPHGVRFIEVAAGVNLEVLDFGGNGPALVLLCGLGNTAHVFDDFAPALTDALHVYAVTRRGFGPSSHPPDGYDLPTRGADLERVLDVLGLERAILAGHSIAGEELTWFAGRCPERVVALVYLDAAYDRRAIYDRLGEPRVPASEPAEAELISPRAYAAFLSRRIGLHIPLGEILAGFVFAPSGRLIRPAMRPNVGRALNAALVHPDYARVTAPALALFVVSDDAQDPVPGWNDMLAASRRQFQSGVAKARVVEFRHAHHYLFLWRRDLVAREMRAFLCGLPSAKP
jgi:non-heme chloroperoxidase